MDPVTKGIIFDLFHTLTGLGSESSSLPGTAEILGVDRKVWNKILFEKSRWRLAGEEKDPVTILRVLAHTIDPTVSEKQIREAASIRAQRFRNALRHVPRENIETLNRLRASGIKLALLSNADAVEVAGWPECPLAECFDVAIFSCDVGHVKPERQIYEACLSRMKLESGHCLFVGDGSSHELEGAQDMGLRTVMVTGVIAQLWPEEIPKRRRHADHEIRTIPEVLDLVDETGPPTRGLA